MSYIIDNSHKYDSSPPMPMAEAVQHAVNVLPVPEPGGLSPLETPVGKSLLDDLLFGGVRPTKAAKNAVNAAKLALKFSNPEIDAYVPPSEVEDTLTWLTRLPGAPLYAPRIIGKVLKSIF